MISVYLHFMNVKFSLLFIPFEQKKYSVTNNLKLEKIVNNCTQNDLF